MACIASNGTLANGSFYVPTFTPSLGHAFPTSSGHIKGTGTYTLQKPDPTEVAMFNRFLQISIEKFGEHDEHNDSFIGDRNGLVEYTNGGQEHDNALSALLGFNTLAAMTILYF